jgi:hypothetical protein
VIIPPRFWRALLKDEYLPCGAVIGVLDPLPKMMQAYASHVAVAHYGIESVK